MLSLNFTNHFKISRQPISTMNLPCTFPIFLVINPQKEGYKPRLNRNKKKQKNQLLFEFSESFGAVTMCKSWEGESDSELELKVLEFMKNSENPERFPSRNELVEAGRMDLVVAITTRGGWMAMGWNEDVNEVGIENGIVESFDFGHEIYGRNDGGDGKKAIVTPGVLSDGKEKCVAKVVDEGTNDVNVQSSSVLGDSSLDESVSGQSIELERDSLNGIHGILHGLERQRNLDFGIRFEKNGNMKHGIKEQITGSSNDVDSCHPGGSERASSGHDGPLYSGNCSVRPYCNKLNSSPTADTWRAWSVQRAGYADKEFEAAEIDFSRNPDKNTRDEYFGQTVVVSTDIKGALDMTEYLDSLFNEISYTDMRSHLQHLKLELSSALHSLTSTTTDLSENAEEHSPEDPRGIYDASEFQENEIMHIHNKLRSMRAKLAVLEGKMSLAIMSSSGVCGDGSDAQKILEEKQKRIDDAHIALQLLRTTCIVWPNSGSEVLLAGSFDGWATQRKMERSRSGIFSLCLRLYPGRYEIKFIVDGEWTVDPLRPTVNNNGYENNLLTVP